MGSTVQGQLYVYIHKSISKKLNYFQKTKTLQHVSATVHRYIQGYLRSICLLSIALPADGYRQTAEKM
jgi:hypothetical protein